MFRDCKASAAFVGAVFLLIRAVGSLLYRNDCVLAILREAKALLALGLRDHPFHDLRIYLLDPCFRNRKRVLHCCDAFKV